MRERPDLVAVPHKQCSRQGTSKVIEELERSVPGFRGGPLQGPGQFNMLYSEWDGSYGLVVVPYYSISRAGSVHVFVQ